MNPRTYAVSFVSVNFSFPFTEAVIFTSYVSSGAFTNFTSGSPVSTLLCTSAGSINCLTPSSGLSFWSSESIPRTRLPGAESISAFSVPKYGC